MVCVKRGHLCQPAEVHRMNFFEGMLVFPRIRLVIFILI